MSRLIHIIYCSTAQENFTEEDLQALLVQSREKNARLNISGMLLFVRGSFFQVLEGQEETVLQLYRTISEDERHTHVTTIIHETIRKRDFSYWSMGYVNMSAEQAEFILGANDFFNGGESLTSITEGRAQKLLLAFKKGHWRTQLSNLPAQDAYDPDLPFSTKTSSPEQSQTFENCKCTFAFQPIINVMTGEAFSHEALIRGHHKESALELLDKIDKSLLYDYDARCRLHAIKMASQLQLETHLNLNILPGSTNDLSKALNAVLDTAQLCGFHPRQIIIEILEHELIGDTKRFAGIIDDYRHTGLLFAIDDFGSGYAGLNLLSDFQPDFIKLDIHLVHHIERDGVRQAIIRGILLTCLDLGIDVIAEGVETKEEYTWLRNQGIILFQGYLFSKPIFEGLSQRHS